MLHAKETGISFGRLGLWLLCAFTFTYLASSITSVLLLVFTQVPSRVTVITEIIGVCIGILAIFIYGIKTARNIHDIILVFLLVLSTLCS